MSGLVFKLLLEAPTYGLVFLALAVGLENGAIVPSVASECIHRCFSAVLIQRM